MEAESTPPPSAATSAGRDAGAKAADTFEAESVDLRRLSEQLVRLIDFLFALTLGQGILLYQAFWTDPLRGKYVTVALALAAIYLMTVQSFIDWHRAMERRPYLMTPDIPTWPRLKERMRVFVDLVTVMLYAYTVINGKTLITNPARGLEHFLIGFPLMFMCYWLWGLLRKARYPAIVSSHRVSLFYAIIFAAGYVLYVLLPNMAWLGGPRGNNDFTLVMVIAGIVAYRLEVGRRKRQPDTPSADVSRQPAPSERSGSARARR
jgi:hypothetical protein